MEQINLAQKDLKNWSNLDLNLRLDKLNNFKNLIIEKKDYLAETISKDAGKPLWESKTEVAAMVGKLDISIKAYKERCEAKITDLNGVKSITKYKPHGVLAVIGPFNFPMHLPAGHIIPALIAGNTIVFKPSEFTKDSGEVLVKLMQEAQLPVYIVQGGAEIGKKLISNKKIKGVLFTGSSNTGLKIQKKLLEIDPGKILALEMGGNNPLVINDYKEQKAAIYNIIQSAYITAGQRCTCARRLIVVKTKENIKLIDNLIGAIKKIKVGLYTESPEPFLGPVISYGAAVKILDKYKQYIKLGCKELVELKLLDNNIGLLSPSLLDVTGIDLPDEELFGPLLKLTWVDNFEQSISEANNTEYGLSAGIFTESEGLYKSFWQEINAGIVNWNRPLTGASGTAPFGGVGLSGNHRPSAYLAADYCAYPVASLEADNLNLPEKLLPGIEL